MLLNWENDLPALVFLTIVAGVGVGLVTPPRWIAAEGGVVLAIAGWGLRYTITRPGVYLDPLLPVILTVSLGLLFFTPGYLLADVLRRLLRPSLDGASRSEPEGASSIAPKLATALVLLALGALFVLGVVWLLARNWGY